MARPRYGSFGLLGLLVVTNCAIDARELTVQSGQTTQSSGSGNGDGDTNSGDGDTNSGDGDATSGDGDATSGDGDGDGDGDSGTTDTSGPETSGPDTSGPETSGPDTTTDDPEPVDGRTVIFDIYEAYSAWVDRSSNDLGIQGGFFVLQDSVDEDGPIEDDGLLHTVLSPETFHYIDYYGTGSGQYDLFLPPCVSGIIAGATTIDGYYCYPELEDDCAWDILWGGGIAMNLNIEPGEGAEPEPYDAQSYGITGLSVTLSGYIEGALRIDVVEHGSTDVYCVELRTFADSPTTLLGKTYDIDLADARLNCWSGSGPSVDPSKIESFHVQFPVLANTPAELDTFCVDEVAVY